jgi:transcriptional regulator with XRE-family HTH domain
VPREPDPAWITDQRRRLGVRVRQAREHAGLTQERLDELSGVKRLTIQRIENGETDARYSWLLRIADTLKIPVTSLLQD